MKIDILGTKYEIILDAEEKNYPELKGLSGYTDFTIKKIVIKKIVEDESTVDDLKYYQRETLRHEIIHAFFYESGLDGNSDYARNEELVDWIAIQFEKMLGVFIELKAISIPNEMPTLNLKCNIDQDKLVKLLNENIDNLINIGGGG